MPENNPKSFDSLLLIEDISRKFEKISHPPDPFMDEDRARRCIVLVVRVF